MPVHKLSGMIHDARHLIVDLPPEVPSGPVEITLRTASDPEAESTADSSDRHLVRARLRAAGFLSEMRFAPDDAQPLSEAERLRVGVLPPGVRPSEELIAEDRDRF